MTDLKKLVEQFREQIGLRKQKIASVQRNMELVLRGSDLRRIGRESFKRDSLGISIGALCACLTEEVGEFLQEIGLGQEGAEEIKIFDALCDINFLIHNITLHLDLPLEEGTLEVARSNLTKTGTKENRFKDENYSPPNLVVILENHRKRNQ